MTAGCRQSIDDLLKRDLPSWQGLPPGCALAGVLSWYPFNTGEGAARLGERQVEYRYRTLSDRRFQHPVFFYYRDDRLSCISADFWSLDHDESAAALHKLGAPADRLDAYFRDTRHADAEWIYADRGLAVHVNPNTGLIARLQGFPPTTTETFRELYRVTELVREFPR